MQTNCLEAMLSKVVQLFAKSVHTQQVELVYQHRSYIDSNLASDHLKSRHYLRERGSINMMFRKFLCLQNMDLKNSV